MKHQAIYLMVFVMISCVGISAYAQLPGDISIHGFGGWAYGKTDNENRYLVGDEDGNYDSVNFSLNVSANPYEKLSVYFQEGYNEGSGGDEIVLDYAFAEWYFADAFILRAGKVKAPFMIYTEVLDVGTIRPFFTLPQGVYQQTSAEAYNGLGITGSLYTAGGWGILYDMYGGKLNLQPIRTIDFQRFTFDFLEPIVHDMIGGRLTVQTPFDGFSVGLSSYTGDIEFKSDNTVVEANPFEDRYTFLGASAEYLSDRWWLRSEYLTQKDSPKIEIDAVYFEAAYQFTEHWQVAARYEFADLTMPATEPFLPEALLDHKDITLGLNYWFNPNLVFKLSYHFVDNNGFAILERPEDFLAALQGGGFDETTNLIVFGTQFSF